MVTAASPMHHTVGMHLQQQATVQPATHLCTTALPHTAMQNDRHFGSECLTCIQNAATSAVAVTAAAAAAAASAGARQHT